MGKVISDTPMLPGQKLPWTNQRGPFDRRAELDGKVPESIKDRAANMMTPIPEVLTHTGAQYKRKDVGKRLEQLHRSKLQAARDKIDAAKPPFAIGPFLPVDLKVAFDNLDYEKGGGITKDMLRQVLAQSGISATDTELHNMVSMASTVYS